MKITEDNVSGVPEQKMEESLEGLEKDLSNEARHPASNNAEEINRLVEGVASGMSPSESIQRYKDAVRDALECEYDEFLYSQSMGSWKRWAYVGHVERELGLGEEQLVKAQKEVLEECRINNDPKSWKIFQNGTPEERKALQDEIARRMCEDDAAEPGSGLSGRGADPDDGGKNLA